ncbi:YjcG family protein [Oceanobacillus sp. FSL H7-0719]|uniref:YjcG family protein n=1 Tax=Oceanobacillus sp. FSL H7-0719 TaxID=2954507 RepID=UPI00324BF37A
MNFGIAFFPSKEIQDVANSFRKRYDPRYALIPPHITLKDSFEIPEDAMDEVIAELRKIASETKPFPIQITKVSSFEPVTNTIYFKINPVPEMTELEEKLHAGKFENTRKHPFIPHVTLAQELTHNEFTDILGRFNMENHQYEDVVDRFQLLYQLENGSWTVHETFVFNKE